MINPIVSVLMTSFNREKLIVDAINSVLSSTLENFELIVVDDLSSDNSFEVAKSFELIDKRVRVYRNDVNLGDYVNRNRAALYAKGKYLKYLDSDDMIYPFGLKVFVDSMERFPEAAFGTCSTLTNADRPFPILLKPEEAYKKHFFKYGVLDKGPSGTIVRRDVFELLGGFTGQRYIGDQELSLKIAARYPILELHASLIFWRQHEDQEFVLGTGDISGGYFMMELPMIQAALSDVNCPLSPAERGTILKRRRKEYVRTLIKHSLRTGEFSKAMNSYRRLNLSLF